MSFALLKVFADLHPWGAKEAAVGTRIFEEIAGAARLEPRGSRRRILIVDDEPTIRNILIHVLKLQGYDVLVAMNGREALSVCTTDPGRIDVLISDLMMPEMDGVELIRRATGLRPEMATICLSASHADVSLDTSVLFLPKPFSLQAIVSTVRSALEGAATRRTMTG
jgi:two-component system cell cycle sensor histidine kinase/response regulator CckA